MARVVGDDIQRALVQLCRQQMPRQGLCPAPVDHVCDVCGKAVCAAHIRLARFDPEAPGGRRWLHSDPPPEICITCCVLEVSRGRERVEEIDEGARERFYMSEEAVGLLGADEIVWLESRGYMLGPDGRPMPRPKAG
jgi:hypothetical protein